MTRFVKLTDMSGVVRYVNPELVEALWPGGDETTRVLFTSAPDAVPISGTAEDVARLLAGEGEGSKSDDEWHESFQVLKEELGRTEGNLAATRAGNTALSEANIALKSQLAAVTQERDRWRKMEGDANDKLAAVTAERDEARAEVGVLQKMVDVDVVEVQRQKIADLKKRAEWCADGLGAIDERDLIEDHDGVLGALGEFAEILRGERVPDYETEDAISPDSAETNAAPKFSYSTDGEAFSGRYASRQEAAREGFDDNPDSDTIETAEIVQPTNAFLATYIDADDLREALDVRAHDNYGEPTEGWPSTDPDAQCMATIHRALSAWLDRVEGEPPFWGLKNTQEHQREDHEEEPAEEAGEEGDSAAIENAELALEALLGRSHEDEERGCLIWGGPTSNGYGRVYFEGATWRAHRLSWVAHNEPIPPGMVVCHKCDVRACINPSHLFLGTQSNNLVDAREKGRLPNAKLSEKDAAEIRRIWDIGGVTKTELGLQFGVSRRVIYDVVKDRSWVGGGTKGADSQGTETGGGVAAPVHPEPAPATPTTGWAVYVPPSTSGIKPEPLGVAKILPLTSTSGPIGMQQYLPGCGFVLYVANDFRFDIVPDSKATDGPAIHPIRWRVNNGGNPFTEDAGSSDASYVFNPPPAHKTPKLWPVATGPLSIADLGAPLIDANGSKWWRVEAWEDQSAVANKSEATIRPTVFFVCVLAEGQTAPRPPAVGYHASEPIVIGSPVVHPITFTTDNDPSPSEGETSANLLFRDDAHLAQILGSAEPSVLATVRNLVRDGFQSKRNGPHLVNRKAGHHLTLRNQQPQYSALITAFRLLDGTADDADKAWLHDYALNNGLSAPEIQIGEHGDRTSLWGAFSYDTAFEETFSVLCVYAWGKPFGLWTPSEEARIRDQLARFVWVSLQLHRNPYTKWINANGHCQAMWESARDQVCALISIVMPDYSSDRYGHAGFWRATFIIGKQTYFADGAPLVSRSGLFGLLSSEPRWNASPKYFSPNNCGSPLAITLNALKNAGEPVPDYFEDAFLLALDGKLPGAIGVTFWSPAMCNDNWPRLKAAILAKHGKDAVIAAMTNISHTSRTADGKIPGGMGAGAGVLGICLTEVV